VARELAARLLRSPLSQELSGVHFPQGLILLGPAEQLPWCDGVIYLGRESRLYLPTHLDPGVPESWLSQALRGQCPPPWALLPDGRVIGLAAASALAAASLERFCAQSSA
jgi:hypothetical protein